MKKLIYLIPFVCMVVIACKHEPVLPTREISFATEILPIIQSSCQHSGCHGTVNTADFTLLNYSDVMEEGDVKPGNARDSKIYEAVTGAGEEFMPRAPYPALSEKQITLLFVWIEQGAKNN